LGTQRYACSATALLQRNTMSDYGDDTFDADDFDEAFRNVSAEKPASEVGRAKRPLESRDSLPVPKRRLTKEEWMRQQPWYVPRDRYRNNNKPKFEKPAKAKPITPATPTAFYQKALTGYFGGGAPKVRVTVESSDEGGLDAFLGEVRQLLNPSVTHHVAAYGTTVAATNGSPALKRLLRCASSDRSKFVAYDLASAPSSDSTWYPDGTNYSKRQEAKGLVWRKCPNEGDHGACDLCTSSREAGRCQDCFQGGHPRCSHHGYCWVRPSEYP
jgi:hypothetical protein